MENGITVGELIKLLQSLPGDAIVASELRGGWLTFITKDDVEFNPPNQHFSESILVIGRWKDEYR